MGSIDDFLNTTDLGSAKPVADSPSIDDGFMGPMLPPFVGPSNKLDLSHRFAQDIEPQYASKVYDLASRTGLPQDLVGRNYDEIEKATRVESFDANKFYKTSPTAAKWMAENPTNAAIYRDKLQQVSDLESSFQEHSFMSDLGDSLQAGVNNVNAGILKLPASLYNVAALPQNLAYKALGMPERQVEAPDFLTKNALVEYYAKGAETDNIPLMSESVGENISSGNYKKAAQALAVQFVNNAPQQAAFIGSAMAGMPMAGLAFAGTTTAGAAYEESREKGADPATSAMNAILHGSIEAGFESLGTLGILGKWEAAIARNHGKAVSREVMKDLGKTLAYSFAAEGNEEALTSIAQDFSSWATGVDPNAIQIQGLLQRAVDAGILGATSGLLMTSPGAIATTQYRNRVNRQAAMQRDFYLKTPENIKNSQVMDGSPQAGGDLVNEITKATGVENIYIGAQEFSEYFQSKGIPPLEVAAKLDIVKELEQAHNESRDMQIPYAQWISQYGETEHYAALADAVKFKAEGLSVNDTKEMVEKIAKDIKESEEEASSQAKIEDKEIYDSFHQQLVDVGYTVSDAGTMARITSSVFRSLSKQSNVPINDLIKEFAPTIRRGEFAGGEGQVYEQGTPSRVQYNEEEESLRIDQKGIRASGVFMPPEGPSSVEDFINPEGVYSDEIDLEETGLNKFERPFRVDDIEISPEMRRGGNGSRALQDVEAAARSNGADAVFLNASPTDTNNKAASLDGLIKFYEKNGYKVIRRSEGNAEMYKPLDNIGDYTQDQRGKIQFGKNQINITLLENADLSTFLHETGHLYLEMLKDLSVREGASKQLKNDFETIREWLGMEEGAEFSVDNHEAFAEAFEVYLQEGKAPTPKLKKTFARIRQWMLDVYKGLLQGRVPLTDDVRQVFDRLVSAEADVMAAEIDLASKPLFRNAEDAGMTQKAWDAYQEKLGEAKGAAYEIMIDKYNEQANKVRSKEYKAAEKAMRKSVTEEVNQRSEYIALYNLQKGTMPDGSPTTGMKLARQDVIDNYGEDGLKALPRGVTATDERGMAVSDVATMLGYKNADALILDLSKIVPKKEMVDMLVTHEMKAKYGPELLSPEIAREEAVRAIHNDRQNELMHEELKYLVSEEFATFKKLTKKIAGSVPSVSDVRRYAAQVIGSTNVGDIKPILYKRAERKAQTRAAEAFGKGDFQEAFNARRDAIYNAALFKEATLAKELVEKKLKWFDRLRQSDEKLAKTRDMNLVNAARSVAAMYGAAPELATDLALDYMQKLTEYTPGELGPVKEMVGAATLNKGPYKEVSFDNFSDMAMTVEALWSLSKSTKEMEIGGEKVQAQNAMDEMAVQLEKSTRKMKKKTYDSTASKSDKFRIALLSNRAALTRIEHWVDLVDFGFGGPFRKYIFEPISKATDNYRTKNKAIMTKYKEIIDQYQGTLTKEEIAAPEIGFVFKNKAELMMAILHTGNESNKRKLLVGRGWGDVNENNEVNTRRWDQFIARMQANGALTKQDYDFAQSIWNLLESMKPETQRAHKAMYGYFFSEITAQEIETPFGKYRGGYIPAKIDIYGSEDAAIRQERENFEKNSGSYSYPTTGRGFTNSRIEQYAAPLSLDMNLLGNHIDGVMRFTYIEPTVKSVASLLMNKGFRKQLAELDPTIAKEALIPWLQRAATQQVVLPSDTGNQIVDAAAGHFRRTAAVQAMFFNVTNTLQQLTGLAVAMTKVKPKHIRNALVRYLRNPKLTSGIATEKSSWLANSQDNSIYEISKGISEIILNPNVYQKALAWTDKHTYVLQSMAQNIVNNVVWMGAYDQAIGSKMTEEEAIKFADHVVRTTQGTNRPEDISRFETGTKGAMVFKQFFGYFNMLANLNSTEFLKVTRELGVRKGAGRLFYVYSMGIMIPAVISEIIVKAMAGAGFDEDDDDRYADDFLKMFFSSQFKTIVATVPYAGQFANAAYNTVATNNLQDDRVSLSPAISMLESAVKVPVQIYKNVAEDVDNGRALTKDALTALGLASGFPTGPFYKPIRYSVDVSTGRAEPTGPIDFARGLVTGKPGKQ